MVSITKNGKLIDAVRKDDVARAQELLDKGADIKTKEDTWDGKRNLLTAACAYGHVNMAKFMIEKGLPVNSVAADNYDTNIIKVLIAAGVNKQKLEELVLSNLHSLEKITLLLDHGADINYQNWEGETALIYSARNGYIDTVRLLLDRGCRVDIERNDGYNAARLGKTFEMRQMIKERMPKQHEEPLPAAELSDLVTQVRLLDGAISLREVFDFVARERISTFQHEGKPVGEMKRENFDSIPNQISTLTPAFEKYQAQGGTLSENVIRHKQKGSTELLEPIILPKRSAL